MRCARAGALAALGVLGLAARAVAAQPLYVIEQLVVNLHSVADGSGEAVATLKSGDRVELIERSNDAAHVRLADGRDGWLRASYLSADEPLAVRLAQRDQQLAQLQDELRHERERVTAPSAPAAAPPPRAAAPPPAPLSPARFWPWALGGMLTGLAAGAALGVLLLDRHIRRKFGGLRIY